MPADLLVFQPGCRPKSGKKASRGIGAKATHAYRHFHQAPQGSTP
jgi:hypothetical protein